jgi:dodecin
MSEVFKSIELVAESETSFDEAVKLAVRRAAESMRELRWLEVIDQRAYIKGGDVRQFQVKVRIWFALEH